MFKRQIDAKRWVATEESKVVHGDWIDPAVGKITFAALYANWAPRQAWQEDRLGCVGIPLHTEIQRLNLLGHERQHSACNDPNCRVRALP